jgi:hypothetical protein
VLRHIVLLTLDDGADVDAIVAALEALPPIIPSIRSYEVGRDLGLADGNHQLGIVALFDDADGWRAYQQHEAHQAAITQLIRPFLQTRAATQFEVD